MAVPPPSPSDAAPSAAAPPGKPALRTALRAARAEFAGRVTAAMRDALAAHLREAIGDARLLGGYVAARGEPDVIAALSGSGHRLALPRAETDGAMRFVAWDGATTLAAGRFGIGEPPDGDEVTPDTLLVPLIGFDRAGNRLGQGGGYYDRWLAAHPEIRAIGVGWSVQEVPALAAEPWDRPLRLIVTEEGAIHP